jgi:hypothetical protein
MKRCYRRTALSRVWQCELHPGDGLEVRHFGRTRFLPNWQPAPIKAPAFFPGARGSRVGGRDSNPRSPSTVSSVHPGARGTTHGAIVKVRNADRSRRRARRAICGVPGRLSHGQSRPRARDRLPRFRASGGVGKLAGYGASGEGVKLYGHHRFSIPLTRLAVVAVGQPFRLRCRCGSSVRHGGEAAMPFGQSAQSRETQGTGRGMPAVLS